MTISAAWGTKVISVPKADTTLVQAGPPEIRQLNVDTLRLALKDLEDDEAGMPFVRTHNHNPPVTVGGVTLARVVEIINGYTITFADGQYAVNIVGGNSNLTEVVNKNQVSVNTANSAGLVSQAKLEADVAAILAKVGKGIKHSETLTDFHFLMVDASTKLPKTGLTVSGQICRDGGAWVAISNAVTEVGHGLYRTQYSSAEMNGRMVSLRFMAPGADDRILTIVTLE